MAWVLWPQFEGPERRISFQLEPDPPVLVDSNVELVLELAIILHVYAGGLIFMK